MCASAAAEVLYTLPRLTILRCRSCSQIYQWPLPSREEIAELFRRLYTVGEGEVPELRGYYQFGFDDAPDNPLVQLYDRWLDAIERHHAPGRLLDVGCGTGLFLVAARRRGWEAIGIDASREATAFARTSFGCEVHTGDFDELDATERFDVVTMWDIVEHSRAPVTLLEVARRHLRPGGLVALATPNQRNILDDVGSALYHLSGGRITGPLEKQYVSQHFLYFTPDTLGAALGRAGLAPLELRLEETDLRRLSLSAPTRTALRMLFAVARLVHRQNRLFEIARPLAEAR